MFLIKDNRFTSLKSTFYRLFSFSIVRCSRVKMAELKPPNNVRGMTKLEREWFTTTVNVPCLKVKSVSIQPVSDILKQHLLKLAHFKAIRPVEDKQQTDREIFLNPKTIKQFTDFAPIDQEKLVAFSVDESSFSLSPLQVTYENWSVDDIFSAVLPEGADSASSYSLVGHIIHLNLREHLLDYKHIIGEVLLDKVKQARTIVNKLDSIDSTFRVFKMEVLAGTEEFVTEVKENGIRFKFDFSAVYWNPRLSTEHERIVKKVQPGNILYDVFAGVGPFSIPCAKRKCVVLANDLNPESFKWLQHNVKLNKVQERVTAFNKDGADFIKEDVKQHILGLTNEEQSHIVMNLPSIAVTFLPSFKLLFSVEELKQIKHLPKIHVYCFVKGERDPKEMAQELVESQLGCTLGDSVEEIFFVRNVAPNKDMMRVSFQLTDNMILGSKRKIDSENSEQSECKRVK